MNPPLHFTNLGNSDSGGFTDYECELDDLTLRITYSHDVGRWYLTARDLEGYEVACDPLSSMEVYDIMHLANQTPSTPPKVDPQ